MNRMYLLVNDRLYYSSNVHSTEFPRGYVEKGIQNVNLCLLKRINPNKKPLWYCLVEERLPVADLAYYIRTKTTP